MYKRTDAELVHRLSSRLSHLADDVAKLKAGDMSYAGRVAGELRTLVVTTKTNTPLLLHLAEKYKNKLEYNTDLPPHMPKTATLDWALNSMYQAKYEGKYIHSVLELIKTIADKEGAHEDLEFSDEHIETKSEEFNIGGFPPYVYQLIQTGELVVHVGNKFLRDLSKE
jgi:hypothetical protein